MQKVLLLLIAAALGVFAQPGVRGPVSGFLHDPRSQSVRPILGLPGAALLGPAFEFGAPIQSSAISQAGRFAVVLTAGAPPIVALADWRDPETSRLVALPAALAAPSIFLSESGSSALLLSGARLQVITGLPDAPVLEEPVDLPFDSGAIRSAAIADNAESVLLGVAAAGARPGAIYVLSLAAAEPPTARFLAPAEDPVSLRFLDAGSAAFIERSSSELFLIAGLDAVPSVRRLAGPEDGLADPIALAPAARGAIVVANAGSTALFLDPADGKSSLLSLPAPAGACLNLARPGLILLNGPGEAPARVLELGPEPATFFIPGN